MQSGVDASGTGDGGVVEPADCEKGFLSASWVGPLLQDALTGLSAERATVTGKSAARTFLSDQLTAIGWTPQLHTYPGGSNVYATIPSTRGDTRHIIVGAHYDTVASSPGANDNASGSAVILAVAKYLATTTCRVPNVTVVFFDQEEDGRFGSRAFAEKLVADQTDVIAVHTVDQVGWDEDNDKIVELELPTTGLAAEYETAAAIVGVTVSSVTTGSTDHVSFRDAGFSATGVSEEFSGGDSSPFRHTAQDTTATVKMGYLVLVTKLVGRVLIDEVFPPAT
ncbi:MAG: M28 family peptidase [Deltaproteobacteria bacterium]|nr:M28 family peptidase [Deltaproteobacteria bacterium]